MLAAAVTRVVEFGFCGTCRLLNPNPRRGGDVIAGSRYPLLRFRKRSVLSLNSATFS